MMTLKWTTDVKPHELGKIEQPFVAVSYVTRAYKDKFNPEVRGIDEVIKRFSAFRMAQRDSNTFDKLIKAINEGDIVLMHHHSNMPFSPVFIAKKPSENQNSENADTASEDSPTSEHVEYEVNPSLQGRYMFARSKFTHLRQGFYWSKASMPKSDISEVLGDEIAEDSFEGNEIAPGSEATQEITEEATANLELDYCFDDQSPVDNIPFEVIDSAGTKHTGTLSQGKASLSGLPTGSCEINYVSDSDAIDAEITQLKTELSSALDAMIAEVKVIAEREDAIFEQESFISQYFIRKGAQLTGLYEGGKNLVVGVYDLAVLLGEIRGEARDAAFNVLKKLAAGDVEGIKRDLETLLAYSAKQLGDLAQAFELLLAIADDKSLLKQIATFPYNYIDAHSIVDKERMGGILAFEILLAVLTAGAGAAVSAASKSKYLLKANTALNKIAKLLKRKKLSKKTSPALKQGDNLDANTAPKKQLALEDKPKVVPKTSPDETILEAGSKGGWNKALNGKLTPNHKYIVGAYTYHTDELGRVTKVTGKLDLEKMDRNTYQQYKAGEQGGIKDGLADDEGGHLIASIFKGPGEQINYAAMDGNLNKGAWKRMENKWAEALKGDPPKTVEVEINAIFDGNSKRPSSFEIFYEIDGVEKFLPLENKPGG
ncbi:DNA/RNA non-specific endonuclease [Ningiella sp. W23]|uniref:DNA/RNA non-specific endonuclease n=1 Tax=Ningiella sp. W23 TaxID=3023715 RepID=UPI003756897E